jgi:tRNA 5-methylaminomethyl-2-thiouridine biosynthesis bifunctional protein
VNQEYVLGASFITADRDTSIRQSEHEDNITKLNKILHPSDDSICISEQLNTVGGRVGIRAVSSDRLPVIGQVVQHKKFLDNYSAIATGNTRLQYLQPDYYSGLYIATGFGSRGLAWIPLCAEALACTMNNEPSPLTKGIARACHPNRILVKRLMDNAKPPRRINND